jgi:hypothetical protein
MPVPPGFLKSIMIMAFAAEKLRGAATGLRDALTGCCQRRQGSSSAANNVIVDDASLSVSRLPGAQLLSAEITYSDSTTIDISSRARGFAGLNGVSYVINRRAIPLPCPCDLVPPGDREVSTISLVIDTADGVVFKTINVNDLDYTTNINLTE